MIKSVQKVIKIGSSGGVTIPAKELKRQKINLGDEVEVIVRPLNYASNDDKEIVDKAKEVLKEYKDDFINLSER